MERREKKKKKARSKSGSIYLNRTYRHGGNEAFYTSWLRSKQWCFDCIVGLCLRSRHVSSVRNNDVVA